MATPATPNLTRMPRVFKNFNLIVNGYGFAGIADEVRLPMLRIKLDEHRGAMMDAPLGIDLGMEKMELGFTMAEHNENIFAQFGLVNQNAVRVTFRGAMQDDGTTGTVGNTTQTGSLVGTGTATPYIVTAQGMYHEQKLGTIKTGDRNRLEATMSLRYFKLQIGARPLIEVDIDNFTRIIDGVDQLASMRAALSAS